MALVNPHLAFPFRFAANGHAASNEQGSGDDVQSCVGVAIVTPFGYRVDEPDFGARPEDFAVLPTNIDALIKALERSEPRALVAIEEDPNLIARLESHLRVFVDRAEGGA